LDDVTHNAGLAAAVTSGQDQGTSVVQMPVDQMGMNVDQMGMTVDQMGMTVDQMGMTANH